MLNNWYSSLLKKFLGQIIRKAPFSLLDFTIACVLILFFVTRLPICYSDSSFLPFLVLIVSPVFCTYLTFRISENPINYLGGFVPTGTPTLLIPIISVLETVSLIIRFFLLFVRPFLNLGGGLIIVGLACWGTVELSSFFLLLLPIVLIYETFVAFIQWFVIYILVVLTGEE